MQSNNPVFRRSEEFKQSSPYGQTSYPGYAPSPHDGGEGYAPPTAPPTAGRMTIDTVVQSTAITLGVVVLAAAATWILTGDITNDPEGAIPALTAALLIGSLGAFALSMVNSFKRVVSPPLVIAFAILEGVALGALSKLYDAVYGANSDYGGIVVQAVLGTFAAFAGTLAAYKFFNIQVGNKFRTFVIAAMFGMVALSFLELGLSLAGVGIGLYDNGALGLLFAVAGLVLGVFMLILDFDFIEQGIRNGIPALESWRAAFALTVSLVWIYTNLLRILAILQQD
ncbi:Bax inhibitor-1/YccA family protein [Nocardioides immobilis]|uniref:Bax inhibitor-1/YccA family protein n=1 Tax=Nocardioides immobilis TaxID=2049295 RepID=A0A417Y4Y6_9ACTN|nr:Bax inhibitor-1/YccA family protein [Nocardioides immobilis]RHW27742.1 Bax inhibitor-1/YccA family protein [Nocardioides immobilis]